MSGRTSVYIRTVCVSGRICGSVRCDKEVWVDYLCSAKKEKQRRAWFEESIICAPYDRRSWFPHTVLLYSSVCVVRACSRSTAGRTKSKPNFRAHLNDLWHPNWSPSWNLTCLWLVKNKNAPTGLPVGIYKKISDLHEGWLVVVGSGDGPTNPNRNMVREKGWFFSFSHFLAEKTPSPVGSMQDQ